MLAAGAATGRRLARELAVGGAMAPTDAAALIAVWRAAGGGTPQAAWGPGALCRRLAAWQSGQAADDERLWPPPSEAHQRREAQRRRLADAQRVARDTLRRRDEFERLRQRVAHERAAAASD